MKIVLVHPQIPPNTGNVARLCAATRLPLRLIEPLGFEVTDKHLKRAGLDYWEYLDFGCHGDLARFLTENRESTPQFFSKKATRQYVECRFNKSDLLVFGSETDGLPDWLWEEYPDNFWRIPIFQPGVRSLNLSSAVAIVTYEALRQTGRFRDE